MKTYQDILESSTGCKTIRIKNYPKLLNREILGDKENLSEADTVSGVHCLIDKGKQGVS